MVARTRRAGALARPVVDNADALTAAASPPALTPRGPTAPLRLLIIEEHPVWHAVLHELAQVMTVENYNAWLASTRALDQDGDVLRVAVPAAFNKTWLEQKLHGKVTGALHKIDDDALDVSRVRHVEYVIEAVA